MYRKGDYSASKKLAPVNFFSVLNAAFSKRSDVITGDDKPLQNIRRRCTIKQGAGADDGR
jgi:hypothetical protein